MNLGYMRVESSTDAGTITATIYYDATVDPSGPQPLINGPRGYCLDVSNSGPSRRVITTLPNGTTRNVLVGQGDPVTNRSLTKAQMNAAGYINRSDVLGFTIQ